SMRDYIQTMANKYDTIYIKRTFTATDGTEITLDSNDYGYRVDKDGEYTQLLADLESGAPVEREPVYSIKGYARNGREDLTGTYVEVNLTKQHLWFYKNGNLVVETDFVSGLPTEERETTTGAFPVAYKASPYNLKGGGASGWDVNVEYWMPFYDGQGLHDASWRSSFGGNIYQTDGSHGCINLPSDAAKKIYESMEAGIPVLLYK
ncbi:MAG: murein L,D-transpeptidase, partial [Clostridia bacterium]|nr:murein L,D-transpeptidase [Clostridia bacterium]